MLGNGILFELHQTDAAHGGYDRNTIAGDAVNLIDGDIQLIAAG